MLSRSWMSGVLVLWAGAVVGGSAIQWRYANAPGPREATPEHWPQTQGVTREPTGFTLVMFAHPKCPCTRASLEVLGALLERTGGSFSARVLLWVPDTADSGWHEGELWRRAREMPGVQVHADVRGEEARRFGALTSGHTVVYDPEGRLVFSGGLTATRGHPEEGAGARTLLALARSRSPERSRTEVYGCGLREPSARTARTQGEP